MASAHSSSLMAFIDSNIVLAISMRIRYKRSAWPFDAGEYAVDTSKIMHRFKSYFWNWRPTHSPPPSERIHLTEVWLIKVKCFSFSLKIFSSSLFIWITLSAASLFWQWIEPLHIHCTHPITYQNIAIFLEVIVSLALSRPWKLFQLA